MIELERQIVLDTWVLVHLCRDDEIGRAVARRYTLRQRPVSPIISIVTVGEMYAFARRSNWAAKKRSTLETLLANLVVVDISVPAVLNNYAEISTRLRAKGRSVGHNDRWIAATAMTVSGVVLTGDRDFDPLHPDVITREFIDQDEIVRENSK